MPITVHRVGITLTRDNVVSDDVTITSSLRGDMIILGIFLSKMSPHAKNYEIYVSVSLHAFEDYAEKTVASFFPDTVYNIWNQMVT